MKFKIFVLLAALLDGTSTVNTPYQAFRLWLFPSVKWNDPDIVAAVTWTLEWTIVFAVMGLAIFVVGALISRSAAFLGTADKSSLPRPPGSGRL